MIIVTAEDLRDERSIDAEWVERIGLRMNDNGHYWCNSGVDTRRDIQWRPKHGIVYLADGERRPYPLGEIDKRSELCHLLIGLGAAELVSNGSTNTTEGR